MNAQVVTNSACYTPITATTATWLSAVYQYDSATGTMVILPSTTTAARSPRQPRRPTTTRTCSAGSRR